MMAAVRADYDAKVAELKADLEATRGEKEQTDTDLAYLKVCFVTVGRQPVLFVREFRGATGHEAHVAIVVDGVAFLWPLSFPTTWEQTRTRTCCPQMNRFCGTFLEGPSIQESFRYLSDRADVFSLVNRLARSMLTTTTRARTHTHTHA